MLLNNFNDDRRDDNHMTVITVTIFRINFMFAHFHFYLNLYTCTFILPLLVLGFLRLLWNVYSFNADPDMLP